jgi:hypothetical protein
MGAPLNEALAFIRPRGKSRALRMCEAGAAVQTDEALLRLSPSPNIHATFEKAAFRQDRETIIGAMLEIDATDTAWKRFRDGRPRITPAATRRHRRTSQGQTRAWGTAGAAELRPSRRFLTIRMPEPRNGVTLRLNRFLR